MVVGLRVQSKHASGRNKANSSKDVKGGPGRTNRGSPRVLTGRMNAGNNEATSFPSAQPVIDLFNT